jgi:hypothetical protein
MDQRHARILCNITNTCSKGQGARTCSIDISQFCTLGCHLFCCENRFR